MLCPVHPACTASLRQRWHSNIGDTATSPKLSSMFCQGLLSSLPSAPSSSQATQSVPSAKVSRCRGALCSRAQQQTRRQPGQGARQAHVGPLRAVLATITAPAAGQWPNPAFAGPARPGSRWPEPIPDHAAANSTKLCLTSIVQALWEGSLKSPQGYVLHRWPV